MALDMNDMREMQQALQARYAGWWESVDPEHGKNKLLWMLGECGEVIDILKKQGGAAVAVPGAVWAVLGLTVAAAMTATVICLGKKQMVK